MSTLTKIGNEHDYPVGLTGIKGFMESHGIDFDNQIAEMCSKEWKTFSFKSKKDPSLVLNFEARKTPHTIEFRISLGGFRGA